MLVLRLPHPKQIISFIFSVVLGTRNREILFSMGASKGRGRMSVPLLPGLERLRRSGLLKEPPMKFPKLASKCCI